MDFTIGIFSLADISAEDLLWDRRPWKEHPFYSGPLIGPVELTEFAVTLGVGEYETTIGDFSLLAGESQDVPWIIHIPPDVTEAVSSLNGLDISVAARSWAQRSDIASRFPVLELEQYLTDAGRFLRDVPGPHVLRIITADRCIAGSNKNCAGQD